MVCVLEIPSKAYSYGSLAVEFKDANKPFCSAPYDGFAPGANGAPAGLPSGILPVNLPYTTFEVMVRILVLAQNDDKCDAYESYS